MNAAERRALTADMIATAIANPSPCSAELIKILQRHPPGPKSCLLFALDHKNDACVRRLIALGVITRAMATQALPIAAVRGGLVPCALLVDRCGANARNQQSTALAWAAHDGLLEVCQYLLTQGARASDDNGAPLRWAVARGRLDVCRLLLARAPMPPSTLGAVLTTAVVGMRLEACRVLLSHGASSSFVPLIALVIFLQGLNSGELQLAISLTSHLPDDVTVMLFRGSRNRDLARAFASDRARAAARGRLSRRQRAALVEPSSDARWAHA